MVRGTGPSSAEAGVHRLMGFAAGSGVGVAAAAAGARLIVLAEMFAQVPVYTLRQADLFQDTARRVLEEVRIEDESIVVVLGL